MSWLRALRPVHWLKNGFVFAAPVFARRVTAADDLARVLGAFAVFCAAASTIYLVNDLLDRKNDRSHPVKRRRPIASGAVPAAGAAGLALALGLGGLVAAFLLDWGLGMIVATYLAINLAYSLGLKRVVIVDVMIVAAGFLLRALAGAAVLHVAVSHWLILCTVMVSLFLGFVKRRQELMLSASGTDTRPILREYSPAFLDQMIAVVTSSTVLAYALYVFSPEVAERLGTGRLGLTLPFVLYGIFRYLYLVHQRGEGEQPTELVVADPPFLVNGLLWGATVLAVLYVWP